jgi:hypothetical protein
MKKVSTAAGKATKNVSQPKLTIGLDLGDSLHLVLPARRSGRSAAGAETGHDSEGDELVDGILVHSARSSEFRLAFNRIVVVRYRIYLESRHVAANTINQQLAAVRRLAHEAADAGLPSPELAAGISRVKGGSTRTMWASPNFLEARLSGTMPRIRSGLRRS